MSAAQRILVTGGAGFIGRRLVVALLKRGHEVAVLDDLSSGRRDGLPRAAVFHEADVRDVDAVHRVFADVRPGVVVHLAAQVSIPRSVRDPLADAQVNVGGGIKVLNAAVRAEIGHFLFASSGGAIYGEVAEGKRAPETWLPRPMSPYAASKAAFELQLQAIGAMTGLRHVSLRLANVYGPGQGTGQEARVVAAFADQLLRGERVTLHGRERIGDEGCIRDYVHVDDVVSAFLLALDRELEGIYNVGTGEERTTRQVLDAMTAALGLASDPFFAPPRPFDLKRSVLDATSIREQGWKAEIAFDRGIRETVVEMREKAGHVGRQ